jgi:hypothetical protein
MDDAVAKVNRVGLQHRASRADSGTLSDRAHGAGARQRADGSRQPPIAQAATNNGPAPQTESQQILILRKRGVSLTPHHIGYSWRTGRFPHSPERGDRPPVKDDSEWMERLEAIEQGQDDPSNGRGQHGARDPRHAVRNG